MINNVINNKSRKFDILYTLSQYPNGLTARELANKLNLFERNSTAPILTRLKQNKKVLTNGTKFDKITKRYVTNYVLNSEVKDND